MAFGGFFRGYLSHDPPNFYQGIHEAYYPADIMQIHEGKKVLTLQPSITIKPGKNAAKLPIYGYGNGTHHLTFHNLCAVLKIEVPAWVKTSDRLEVSNTSAAMKGGSGDKEGQGTGT